MKKIILLISITIGNFIALGQATPAIEEIYFGDFYGDFNHPSAICTEDAEGSIYIDVYLYIVVSDADGSGDILDVDVDDIIFSNSFIEVYPFNSVNLDANTRQFIFELYYIGPTLNYGDLFFEDLTVTARSSNVSDIPDFVTTSVSNIKIYGPIDASFSVDPLVFCENDLPVDLNDYVYNPGGEFTWLNNVFPYEYSNSHMFDPKIGYQTYIDDGGDGYYIDYQYTNPDGCSNWSDVNVYFNEAPEINITPSSSTCGNADGFATAEIIGAAPFNVYWSTGKNESGVSFTSTITNASSGVYYINVTDDNGCKNVGKANISDSDISVTPTITSQYCQGQNGNVNLTIIPSTGTVSSIFWSNGATTNNLFAPAGEYSIQVHTTSNCNFFGTYTIPDSSLKVKLNEAYENYNCLSTPDGAIYITTTGGQGTYTWDWRRNESATTLYPGLDVENPVNIEGGFYKCTVSDGSGCSLVWNQTIENNNNVSLWVDEVIKPTCGNNNGSIDIFVDTWGEAPSSYEWNTGSTAEDLINVHAGTYTLTYADASGCENYLTVELENELPYQPQICLLTVDTSLIYNQVIWEKDPSQNIDGFNVYRETSTFGVFEKVAERPYSLESVFVDNAASPVDRSWRYYITTYDGCGGESYGSFIHKTIHITVESISGGTYNLSWDDYEGISYSNIILQRYDNVNGWEEIATLGAGANTYSDTPTELDGLDYFVSFVLTDICTSTKAQDHNASRSNKTSAVFNPGGQTDVSIIEHETGEIKMYPNPTNQDLNIYIENYDNFEYIRILNMNGQVVYEQNITNNFTTVDFSEFSNQIYFVQIVAQDNVITHKIIKN